MAELFESRKLAASDQFEVLRIGWKMRFPYALALMCQYMNFRLRSMLSKRAGKPPTLSALSLQTRTLRLVFLICTSTPLVVSSVPLC